MATLVGYYGDQANGRVKAVNDAFETAKQAANGTRQASTEAQAAFDAAGRKVEELLARIANVQRQLPDAATRPDGDELLDELDFLRAELLVARRGSLAADGARKRAAAEAEVSAVSLNRVAAMRAATTAASADAAVCEKSRATLTKQLNEAPLKDVKADAGKVKTDAADARVKKDIPQDLYDRAIALRTVAITARKQAEADAEAARLDALTATTNELGTGGAVLASRDELDRADAALRLYVTTAVTELERITTTLARIANEAVEPLTEAERANLTQASAELQKARADALKAEKTYLQDAVANVAKIAVAEATLVQAQAVLDATDPNDAAKVAAAQKAVDDATTALDKAKADSAALNNQFVGSRLALIQKRDARDAAVKSWADARAGAEAAGNKTPDDAAEVKAAKQALDTATKDYRTALTQYKTSHVGVLQAWRAAVPAAAWRRLFDLEDLKLALDRLKTTDPAQLTKAAADADVALAETVKDADVAAEDIAAKQDAQLQTGTMAAVVVADGQDRPNP